MNSSFLLGIIGLSATMVIGGLTLILSLEDPIAKYTGVGLIIIGFVITAIFIIYLQFESFKKINKKYRDEVHKSLEEHHFKLETHQKKFETNIHENTITVENAFDKITSELSLSNKNRDKGLSDYFDRLEKVIQDAGLQNNAQFVSGGYIGLQKQVNILESSYGTGNDYVRMSVLGHLPSYMRINDLSEERGRKLYKHWAHLVPDYVKLTNQRKDDFRNFIDKGGIARDIFSKHDIEEYVNSRCTFHNSIEDPIEEVEERLKALLYY